MLSLPKLEWVERLRIRANELMEESQCFWSGGWIHGARMLGVGGMDSVRHLSGDGKSENDWGQGSVQVRNMPKQLPPSGQEVRG